MLDFIGEGIADDGFHLFASFFGQAVGFHQVIVARAAALAVFGFTFKADAEGFGVIAEDRGEQAAQAIAGGAAQDQDIAKSVTGSACSDHIDLFAHAFSAAFGMGCQAKEVPRNRGLITVSLIG